MHWYSKIRLVAEQCLLVILLLAGFFVVFEEKLVLPYWIQPLGRMHPMLLHFPIVLLAVALLLLWIHGNLKMAEGFLLWGSLLAGITVLMGLFLSKEEGYTGEALNWHKWSGALLFYCGAGLYWLSTRQQKPQATKWLGAVLIVPALWITGHYGASLSHGENFILEPILAQKKAAPVVLEEAIVYAHVIQPILQQKCASCHSVQKMKGALNLTDTLAMLKGGKSGPLFIPGNAALSLLLERLHLPLEEKKHMPPQGKPQLTAIEIELLTRWIDGAASFHSRLIELPETDSLRILAQSILQPSGQLAEQFDFAAADENTIMQLNNFDRSIKQVDRESPALEVALYNRNKYTVKQLEELSSIRKQVISINLNKLPVKDADLAALEQFQHLRKLDLNFTDITDAGLATLAALPQLRSLAISGTKISHAALANYLPGFKALQSIAIWNTAVNPQEVISLKNSFPKINIIEGFIDTGADTLKLNPPQVRNLEMVFPNSLPLELYHPVKGVVIRYTMDGSEPDSIRSPVFDGNTILQQHTTIKAKAFKPGWHSSEVVAFDFLQNSFIPDSVRLLTKLNDVHQAEGAETFFNRKLGSIGANNPAWANYWAGVRNNDMVLEARFDKTIALSAVGLHYMIEEATGIYPPAVVEFWGAVGNEPVRLLTKFSAPLPAKGDKPSLKLIQKNIPVQQVTYLKIIVRPYQKGNNRYLLLVDEMFLN
jgi:Leucine-rich repeat (LRR) protein/uncharacterized membrane protein